VKLDFDPAAAAPAVLRAALARGGDFAELYLEDVVHTAVTLDAARIERITTGVDRGAGIRVLHRLKTAYGYTSELSPRALIELAGAVAQAARGGLKAVHPPERSAAPPPSAGPRRDPLAAPLGLKVALCRRADARARAWEKRIHQVTVRYGDARRAVVCMNSLGEWAQDDRVQTLLSVTAVAGAGAEITTGYESIGGACGLEVLDGDTPERVAEVASRRAMANLLARPAPAGRMPVVLAASAGGTMVHEAVGHGLEADLIADGLSIYQGMIGQVVGTPLLTVLDDATLPGRRGSFSCDDEGTPAQRTVLIENGVLRGYLHDRLSAWKAGARSTGNGRRESFRCRPIVRMSNTMIAPGDDDPEDIVRSTERGLFVRQMGGGQVETVSGNFVFEVTEGYLIEKGAVSDPVRGATLTGNGPEVLRGIDRVGRDLGFGIGTCGKDGQSVAVADAQPTLRIPELVVGGRQGT